MKKYASVLIITLILIFGLSFTAFAVGEAQEIWDLTDSDTRELLNELGIDELSFEKLFDLSPTRVIEFFIKNASTVLEKLSGSIVTVIAAIIITAVAVSFLKESDKSADMVYLSCTLCIISAVVVPLSRILTDAAAGIKASAVFSTAYLPVMTAVIAASKSPALALTYNSFTVFLSSAITLFADRFLVPVIGCMLSFNILSSFSFEDFKDRISKIFRRLIVTLLALFSTVYSGLITSQSVLATASDSLALKGIRFISGAFVPIVGSGVGDALSSVFTSFALMKNTLGVFVIIVILLLNFPVMLELLVWYFVLGLCSVASSMFNLKYITEVLDSLSSMVSLLNTVVFFVTFVLTISTGVVISMGK